MNPGSTLYNLVLVLHLVGVVVGFGTAFAWTVLGARARSVEGGGATLAEIGVSGLSRLSAPAIWSVGVTGLILIGMHQANGFYTFADTWISLGFLLFFITAGVTQFLWIPSQRKVQATVAALEALPPGSDRPSAELASLEEQGKQVAVWGGVVHLAFALSIIVMVFKPGFG
ncbi:MAG: DUF2269 family protein [Acidimicrobiia bacterium]|nr:DUF2269 family protein [Acidimicrobiia bacterium]